MDPIHYSKSFDRESGLDVCERCDIMNSLYIAKSL